MQRRNQKLYKQAKAKRIQHHQTSSSTMVKDLYTGNTEKAYKKQIQNNKVNGNRIILSNNYLKCKWVKCSNQKTQTD